MKAVIHVCLHNIPCIYSSPTSSTYPLPCFCVLVRSEYGVFPQRLRYFSWQPDASSTDNSSRPWHCQAFPVCRYSLVAKHKKVTGAWWANTSAANTDLRLDFLMVNREKPSFVTAWLQPGYIRVPFTEWLSYRRCSSSCLMDSGLRGKNSTGTGSETFPYECPRLVDFPSSWLARLLFLVPAKNGRTFWQKTGYRIQFCQTHSFLAGLSVFISLSYRLYWLFLPQVPQEGTH